MKARSRTADIGAVVVVGDVGGTEPGLGQSGSEFARDSFSCAACCCCLLASAFDRDAYSDSNSDCDNQPTC